MLFNISQLSSQRVIELGGDTVVVLNNSQIQAINSVFNQYNRLLVESRINDSIQIIRDGIINDYDSILSAKSREIEQFTIYTNQVESQNGVLTKKLNKALRQRKVYGIGGLGIGLCACLLLLL